MTLAESLQAYPGIRRVTAKRDEVQQFLLSGDGTYMLNGRLWKIRTKHIGAGVYQVWLEK